MQEMDSRKCPATFLTPRENVYLTGIAEEKEKRRERILNMFYTQCRA